MAFSPRGWTSTARKILNLSDGQTIEEIGPLLIAHRGGVVSSEAPEDSLATIHYASQLGYDTVEIIIREAKH